VTRKTILIDGYNLALESGTGIATYARALSRQTHDLGYDTHILYSMLSIPKRPLPREMAFFDQSDRAPNRFKRALTFVREALTSPFGVGARDVPVTGQVITRSFESRLPHFDRIWAARNLFARATRHFDLYGTRLSVRLPMKPDIVHWTYPLPLKVAGAINIYTIHDLVPLRLPYTTLDQNRRYYRICRMLARKADHLVTVSECSRRDIVNLLGAKDDMVTNTYQNVDIPASYADKPEVELVRELEGGHDLPYKGYMLFYGAIEPKKNVGRLIEAYLASRIDTPLVIVGRNAWKFEKELESMATSANSYEETIDRFTFERHRVRRIEYAPFPMLVNLIRGARAVLFPSLYEGFGLPVIEAMQLGTPVLTSRESSLPEIAGDAALFVDPYDRGEITAGIRLLDENAQLREELAAKGRKQAAIFSREAYAARLRNLYSRLA
jgi:glycosyltransferase involved in cell wall biosynthesis